MYEIIKPNGYVCVAKMNIWGKLRLKLSTIWRASCCFTVHPSLFFLTWLKPIEVLAGLDV